MSGLGPGLRLHQPRGPTNRFSFLLPLLSDDDCRIQLFKHRNPMTLDDRQDPEEQFYTVYCTIIRNLQTWTWNNSTNQISPTVHVWDAS
jgi:hypothetical protein